MAIARKLILFFILSDNFKHQSLRRRHQSLSAEKLVPRYQMLSTIQNRIPSQTFVGSATKRRHLNFSPLPIERWLKKFASPLPAKASRLKGGDEDCHGIVREAGRTDCSLGKWLRFGSVLGLVGVRAKCSLCGS